MPAAIVLAGGGPDARLAPGLPNKAFLEMGGRPLITWVLDALRACPAIDRIVAVGPPAPLEAAAGAGVEVVPEQDSMMHNVEAALRSWRMPGRSVSAHLLAAMVSRLTRMKRSSSIWRRRGRTS